MNGNISLNLQTQPQQGTTNFQVISYNCSQQVNISSQQIQVIPSYNGSECDTINSQAINQPGSLVVSLTSTIGNKCNSGNNLGLIIGLSVGIPSALILAVSVVIFILKMKQNKQISDVKDEIEAKRALENAKNNPQFKGTKTEWKGNEAIEMEGNEII